MHHHARGRPDDNHCFVDESFSICSADLPNETNLMSSVFGWLDGDDAHRRRMLEVVKLFQDEGSVDELGIGGVRDAFSNAFFPGTSVLHTRARYLLFVPWLVKETARHGWTVDRSRKELRDSEVKLIRSLLAGGQTRGVIGNQAQEKLKTMPSSVYWAALGRFGLRRWDTTIDGYFRATAQGSKRATEANSDDDVSAHRDLGLDSSLPPAPVGLLAEANFTLSRDEADYLKGVFARVPGNSLLSWLATHGETAEEVAWIWQHPQLAEFDDANQLTVDFARRFHHASYGSALLYNLMLAKLSNNDLLTDNYENELELWQEELGNSRTFDSWDLEAFWSSVRELNPNLKMSTELFLNRWFQLTEDGSHAGKQAQDLIRNREVALKGRRSRILDPGARERWTGGSGLVRLDYRWGVASTYLEDIYSGLEVA